MSAIIETIEAFERPPVSMGSRLEGELLEVSMGPQHPSTHGVFRMNVALEGEVVRKLKPVFGYLHRNHEKIGENTRTPVTSARCRTPTGSIISAP